MKGWYNEYQQKLGLPAGYAGRELKFLQKQKAAALEHYLTHDRCIAATMRALGYPGRGEAEEGPKGRSLRSLQTPDTQSAQA